MSGGSNRTSSPLPITATAASSSSPESDKESTKCTASRVKSVIKTIFAQLFSHVGLCLLVIGYALMGAVIFVALEKEHELKIRENVSSLKSSTLDELYNLTGFLRLEVLIQEEKILQLRESVEKLTNLNRKCDRIRRKDRKFLQTLIETTKRDNVPLTEQQCSEFCRKHKVKFADCEELCSPKVVRCAHWPDSSKCLKDPSLLLQNKNESSGNFVKRSTTGSAEPENVVLAIPNIPGCLFKKFNVLWRNNWTLAADAVLTRFEKDILKKSKSDGYDGEQDSEKFQWSFSGALLYSLTVITTIGYGNISPKTPWGRCVTMIYAIVGVPLFLLWVSQVGTLLASSFKIIYYKICCGLCRRGKRRKALALAAKNKRQEEKLNAEAVEAVSLDLDDEEKSLRCLTDGGSPAAVRTLAATPLQLAHNLMNNSAADSSKSVKIEILQPEVKELLATCAQYNLENVKKSNGETDSKSAQVLEEIRHAEAVEQIQRGKELAKRTPASPLKTRQDLQRDDSSLYDNSSLERDLPVTPIQLRRHRLGHQHSTLVMMDHNGSPVTTLLKPSRDGSPASRFDKPQPQSTIDPIIIENGIPDQMPLMPVIVFILAYFTLGATIFSNWEKWSFLEGFYFCFITLTTIGFGDFVPGDKLLSTGSEDGNAKLILACIYLLLGLAIFSMAVSLMQDTIRDKVIELATELGILDDPNLAEDDD